MDELYHSYTRALAAQKSPALFLDQDAFSSNIRWAIEQAQGKTIRVATKSLRCRQLIQKVLDASPVFQGLMSFTLPEALWLRQQGFKDILMGYPTTDVSALRELARNPAEITLMVDLNSHLELLQKIAAEHQTTFNLCVDVDLSMDLPGTRFGVYRSSIQNETQMEKFLHALARQPNLRLIGLMGYEAQIAGVGDKHAPLMRLLKSRSLPQLKARRQKLVEMVQACFALKFVNGGGTGSLKETVKEAVVTEVTVGSGFYCPVLFDNYRDFTLRPALGFTLPIVRHPAPGIFTALGGGYVASGEAGPTRLPSPYLPQGIQLLKHEGAGEVQTPFKYQGSVKLAVGDQIIMRHAKAGEPCERFNHIHLISGGEYQGMTPTYRGEGQAFL
jgi:D-serine deaminase-like pyridoxal phosphate-dependent protein